jgi:hypothetical protein
VFRLLKADEIDVRVSQVGKKYVMLLLYKNARVDMDILDETVGPKNWQRRHYLIGDNLHCVVAIWDDAKNCWVEKSDVGVESQTAKEKGEASDSFKRACFNWGIGRELYTAPRIFVPKEKIINWENKNGKDVPKDTFRVHTITYTKDKKIDGLAIVNQKGDYVFVKKPAQSKTN